MAIGRRLAPAIFLVMDFGWGFWGYGYIIMRDITIYELWKIIYKSSNSNSTILFKGRLISS